VALSKQNFCFQKIIKLRYELSDASVCAVQK